MCLFGSVRQGGGAGLQGFGRCREAERMNEKERAREWLESGTRRFQENNRKKAELGIWQTEMPLRTTLRARERRGKTNSEKVEPNLAGRVAERKDCAALVTGRKDCLPCLPAAESPGDRYEGPLSILPRPPRNPLLCLSPRHVGVEGRCSPG